MLSVTFYWKEGAPTWVGTAAFSSKKETLKHFRLEVRPFLGITLSVCCAASSPGGGKRWSLHNAKASPTRRGVTEGDGEVVQRDSKDGHCFIL